MEFKTKDQNHVEWAKAMKELFLPGLRDFVKSFYPLGPIWSPVGKMTPTTTTKIPASSAPAPPSAPIFRTETSQASPQPKQGMSAVFQEISSGKSVTEGTIDSAYNVTYSLAKDQLIRFRFRFLFQSTILVSIRLFGGRYI